MKIGVGVVTPIKSAHRCLSGLALTSLPSSNENASPSKQVKRWEKVAMIALIGVGSLFAASYLIHAMMTKPVSSPASISESSNVGTIRSCEQFNFSRIPQQVEMIPPCSNFPSDVYCPRSGTIPLEGSRFPFKTTRESRLSGYLSSYYGIAYLVSRLVLSSLAWWKFYM